MNLNGQQLITNLQSQFLKPNLPTIKIGDNIKIGVKII
jgi:ribosomal protein L19